MKQPTVKTTGWPLSPEKIADHLAIKAVDAIYQYGHEVGVKKGYQKARNEIALDRFFWMIVGGVIGTVTMGVLVTLIKGLGLS